MSGGDPRATARACILVGLAPMRLVGACNTGHEGYVIALLVLLIEATLKSEQIGNVAH